jgi:pilus assembly protein Flp/PilA
MIDSIATAVARMFVRWEREDGQALAEYGLVLGLIAVVAIVALTALGLAVTDKIQTVADAIP